MPIPKALSQGGYDASTPADCGRSFQQLLGDLARREDRTQEALAFYAKAIRLDPGYFAPYLSAGIAHYEQGDRAKAEQSLSQSTRLLPNAPAVYYLGNIARDQGNLEKAMDLYSTAASSQSPIGKQAAAAYAALERAPQPGQVHRHRSRARQPRSVAARARESLTAHVCRSGSDAGARRRQRTDRTHRRSGAHRSIRRTGPAHCRRYRRGVASIRSY